MKRIAILAWPLIAVMLMLSPAEADEAVLVGGTGSGSLLIQKLSDRYQKARPGTKIRVITPTLGSNGSLRALAAGRIDIAVSGRPPKPEEGDFAVIEYARTPLVFASREAKQAQGFKLAEVIDIYAGKRQHWADGSPIRLVLRNPFESDTQILRQLNPELKDAVDSALHRRAGPFGESDLDTVELIHTLPGAFGPSSLGLLSMLGHTLTVMPLDGIPPSIDALANGSYPLSKPFFLVTRKHPTPPAANFIGFLQSAEARHYLRQSGFLPGLH